MEEVVWTVDTLDGFKGAAKAHGANDQEIQDALAWLETMFQAWNDSEDYLVTACFLNSPGQPLAFWLWTDRVVYVYDKNGSAAPRKPTGRLPKWLDW